MSFDALLVTCNRSSVVSIASIWTGGSCFPAEPRSELGIMTGMSSRDVRATHLAQATTELTNFDSAPHRSRRAAPASSSCKRSHQGRAPLEVSDRRSYSLRIGRMEGHESQQSHHYEEGHPNSQRGRRKGVCGMRGILLVGLQAMVQETSHAGAVEFRHARRTSRRV